MKLRHKQQRGAAALEFAMVLPVFLGLLSMSFSVGMGLWSRYEMLNYATSAARYCAFQSPITPAVRLGMPTCVNNYINTMIAASGSKPRCNNLTVTPTLLPGPANNSGMQYLEVELDCTGNWLGDLLVSSPGGGVNFSATTYNIVAKSAMPFMLTQGP